jgi:hypothetical protein
MQHRHLAWTFNEDMHTDMQVYILKTCSIDMDKEHRHTYSGEMQTRTDSMEIQHVHAACMHMLNGPAAWRSSRIQLEHAALI